MGGWAPVAALAFFFLLSSHFILLHPPPSSSSSPFPLYLGVSCLIALERRGDPASWFMVTPPQLVTSKRGHCSFCSPLLLNFTKQRSSLQGKNSCKEKHLMSLIGKCLILGEWSGCVIYCILWELWHVLIKFPLASHKLRVHRLSFQPKPHFNYLNLRDEAENVWSNVPSERQIWTFTESWII